MILYVLRYYPTLSETFVYREIAELRRRQIPVTVLALGNRPDGALQDELPDVPVLRAPRGLSSLRLVSALGMLSRRSAPAALGTLARLQRPRDVLRALWLAQRSQALRPIRVHAHFAGEAAEVARALAALLEIPWSVTVHAVDLFKPRPHLGDLLQGARPACTISAHNAQVILDRYGVTAPVVRMGVDVRRFTPSLRTHPLTRPARAICVARYAPKKGIDSLLQVFRALPTPPSLHLVSDGPVDFHAPWLQRAPLPPSKIPPALAEADLFVLPCRVAPDGDRDGLPVALLEAMASGLPVLTTDLPGIDELVDEEVGWRIPPNDPVALKEALLQALADPALRRAKGQAARERILQRGLTVSAQVDALLTAWETR